jgi:NTP pyrophosphatase (non-canonical NTP hydrolase)
MKIKHTLASSKDKKCTITSLQIKHLDPNLPETIQLFYPDYNLFMRYHKSRNDKTYYADMEFNKIFDMPKIGEPKMHEVELVVRKEFTKEQLQTDLDLLLDGKVFDNQFQHIRNWAEKRGLYEKGDVKTQYVKLQEEAGELAKAIIKSDHDEFIDAIGDCIVVLTNLAHLGGVKIEDCINSAYDVIAKRTGKMENGTFVKDIN